MLPKITVITPSLNQAEYIEKTIRSVIDQKYPALEYLVFDGGSTDGTAHILERYSSTLKYWIEPDRGQTHAINKGLQIATGEIVTFLNSDDLYEPSALLVVAQFFLNHPEAQWVTGKCRIIDSDDREIMRLVTFYKNSLLKLHHPSLLKIVNYISQPATFWRKSLIEEIGFFDEKLVYVMDYDYWLRIAQKYPLFLINQYLAKFRTYPESKTRQSALHNLDEESEVIQRYTKSSLTKKLHKVHRLLIQLSYAKVITNHR